MAGLGPAIYAAQLPQYLTLYACWSPITDARCDGHGVGGRDKPGHDGFWDSPPIGNRYRP
jgi:hypothetical protein